MAYTYEYARPAVTADVVAFAMREGALKVLLVRRKHPPFVGAWATPGGFIEENERAEPSARRELAEETGIADVRLSFLNYYDRPDRDPRGRTITLAFLGIVGPDPVPLAGDDAAEARWHPIDDLPELAFDHAPVLQDAVSLLRERGRRTTLLFGMLPPRFLVSDARTLYEAVYAKKIDPRRFAARLRSCGILVKGGRAGRTWLCRLRARADELLARKSSPLLLF